MPVTTPKGPKCPRCGKELVKVENEKGHHCPECDSAGFTNVYKRGNTIVGRP